MITCEFEAFGDPFDGPDSGAGDVHVAWDQLGLGLSMRYSLPMRLNGLTLGIVPSSGAPTITRWPCGLSRERYALKGMLGASRVSSVTTRTY